MKMYHCEQTVSETLREFVHRFNNIWNNIPKVSDYDVIQAFTLGVMSRRCVKDIAIQEPKTVKELIKIIDESAKVEDVLLFINKKTQGIKLPQPGLEGDKAKAKHKQNAKGDKGKKNNFEEIL